MIRRVAPVVVTLLAGFAPAVQAQVPPVDLRVDRDAAPGSVLLEWTGGDPMFELFRAADPATVTDAGNEIGETRLRRFDDDPPAGSLWFYRVGMRPPTVPEAVTIELTRANDDPVGRPLPVAASWNPGRPSSGLPGWDPDFMMDYLEAGYPVIPGFYLRRPTFQREPAEYYERLERARTLGIPFAVIFTQWDRPFTDDPRFFDLPPAENPNVIDAADGTTIVAMTDPEGPIAPWQQVGSEWAQLDAVSEMTAIYPDPPRVLWVNNFEQPRLDWQDAETSWRFIQNHGSGTTDGEDKRRIVGDGWVARDGALWDALHQGLPAAWQQVSIPVCYTAFGRGKYGSWSGWDRRSLHVSERFSPWPRVVNGSPSYYVFDNPANHNETDYQANAPQAVASNWQFMLDEAFLDAPDYHWEYSIFDGGTSRHNWYRFVKLQIYDEPRYQGYVRYGLWMARPRVLREFRFSNRDRAPYVTYWEALLASVREVHEDADLKRFWRHGEPVPNPRPHHWQSNLVAGYTDADVDRNFILDADANPPHPWANTDEIAVWALALVLGEAPNREWLLFAYAPLADRPGTTISIPDYGDVTVDVPRGAGNFWYFSV